MRSASPRTNSPPCETLMMNAPAPAAPTSPRFEVRYWKEPASALTHFVGFLAAIAGLIVLLIESPGGLAKTLTLSLYGASLTLLFLSSSTYHFFDLGERGNMWLRRLDHSAIFLLIAGTYLPAVMHTLVGGWRLGMLIALGALTLCGVLFKLTWFHCPRWLDALIYLAMGWSVVIPNTRMFSPLASQSVAWIVAGGLFYTVGALTYAIKRPDPWPDVFGFHEVWHMFVLAGAGCHFFFVYSLLDTPIAPF